MRLIYILISGCLIAVIIICETLANEDLASGKHAVFGTLWRTEGIVVLNFAENKKGDNARFNISNEPCGKFLGVISYVSDLSRRKSRCRGIISEGKIVEGVIRTYRENVGANVLACYDIVRRGLAEVLYDGGNGQYAIAIKNHRLVVGFNEDIRPQLSLSRIRHNFNGFLGNFGTFLSSGRSFFCINHGFSHQTQLIEKESGLTEGNKEHQTSEEYEALIDRRFIFAVFTLFNFIVSIHLSLKCLDKNRRILSTAWAIWGFSLYFVGLLLWWLTNFAWSWDWIL